MHGTFTFMTVVQNWQHLLFNSHLINAKYNLSFSFLLTVAFGLHAYIERHTLQNISAP